MKKTFFWTGAIYKLCSLLVLFFSLCFVGCEKETLLTNTGDHNQSTLDSTRFDVIELEELKTFKPAQQFINEMEPYINTLADSEKEDQFDTRYILRERLDSYSKYYFKTKNFQNLYENGLEFKNLVVTIFPNGEYHMRVILFQYSESNETDGYSLTKNTFVSLKDFQHASLHNKSLQARSSSCFNSLDDALSNCSSIPPTISYYVCNYGYTYIHGPERVGADWCSGSLYWETENLNYTACIEAAHKEYQAFISETDGICDDYEPDSGNNEGHYGTAFDEDQIINHLTEKAKCVYDKLQELSGGFRNAIKKFDGDFPVSHLKFSMKDLADNKRGQTAPPNNSVTEIFLNNDASVSGVNYRPNLLTAKTIIHEVIHAEMFRKLLSLSSKNGNIDVSKLKVMLKNGDYPGMLDYYTRYGNNINSNWQHQQMAAHYRGAIADVLQDFDNSQHSRQFYLDLAWEGLNHSNIVAWKDAISQAERDRINNTIANYIAQHKNQTCR